MYVWQDDGTYRVYRRETARETAFSLPGLAPLPKLPSLPETPYFHQLTEVEWANIRAEKQYPSSAGDIEDWAMSGHLGDPAESWIE